MKIDILIPTYNRKGYLIKAINSVLKQTYKNINIIISDNASTDWTDEIIKNYKKKYDNIKYYKNETNIWPLYNFKKCIYEYSKSNYVLFLSDDDELIDENYIKNAVDFIQKNENTVIVISNSKIIYQDLNLEFIENKKLPKIINWKDFFMNYWTWDYNISRCNAIFNRRLAIENDCYNWKIFYADSDCFFRLMMFGNIWFIDTIWSLYRLHSSNSYKKADVDLYIKNLDFINRNYCFSLNYIKDISILNIWKDRFLKSYLNSVFNNLILFSEYPLKNIKFFNKILLEKKNNFHKLNFSILSLFIVRYLIKMKIFYKLMILINNRK